MPLSFHEKMEDMEEGMGVKILEGYSIVSKTIDQPKSLGREAERQIITVGNQGGMH